MSLKKNDIRNIRITGMTSQGSGVGTSDGMAVFVANSAVGDILSVRIIKTSKKYAIGKIEEIITPAPCRIQPDCPVYNSCGGCVYRHMTYTAEAEVKRQKVFDAITRIGEIKEPNLSDIILSDKTNGYRNKAQLPIGKNKENKITVGFYAFKSHRIIPSDNCMLQPPVFTDIINIFKLWAQDYNPVPYNEETHKGMLRHLYIRYGEKTGEIMVCLVINGKKIAGEQQLAIMLKEKIKGFKSLIINTNTEKTNVILGKKCTTVYGSDYITDILCGLRFKISPLSFYQVNPPQAEKLYNKARQYAALTKDDILLDLYCGTGTIGLTMANECKKLIGVEVVEQAVEDAKENARLNNINNAEFICADAAIVAKRLEKEGIKPDVIVLDPPRKGCDSSLIDTVAKMNPKRIVYVSCDPATLARDLKLFTQNHGYTLQEATPFDLFPRTAHVETVVLLSRKDVHECIKFDVKGR